MGGTTVLGRGLLLVIRFYRSAVSPLLPPACRYTPSCSAYAEEAVRRYGGFRGGWLAIRRLLRCHPFGGQGYDPVPVMEGSRRGDGVPARRAPDGTTGAARGAARGAHELGQ